MCYDRHVIVSFKDESKILMLPANYRHCSVLIKEAVKLLFPELCGLKYEFITCFKSLSVKFDPAVTSLEKNHDWEKFPVCSLKTVETSKGEKVYVEWIKENGRKGLLIFDVGEVCLISTFFDLEFIQKRNRERVKAYQESQRT